MEQVIDVPKDMIVSLLERLGVIAGVDERNAAFATQSQLTFEAWRKKAHSPKITIALAMPTIWLTRHLRTKPPKAQRRSVQP